MEPVHDVGARQDEVLVAPLVGLAAEVGRGQVLALDPGPGRAVQNEDALGKDFRQSLGALPRGASGRFALVHDALCRVWPGRDELPPVSR